MNIKQLVGAELVKLLTDAEASDLGAGLKAFVNRELETAKEQLKEYVDAELLKLATPVAVTDPNQTPAPSA